MQAILYVLCFVCILKGSIQYFYFRNKNKHYYRVKGVVVENYLDEMVEYFTTAGTGGAGGYRHYYPIVEFIDKDGNKLQLQSDNYNPDRPMYEEGAKVSLLVNPNDNNRFLFDEKADRLIVPLVWIGIGIVGILFSYYIGTQLPEQQYQ